MNELVGERVGCWYLGVSNVLICGIKVKLKVTKMRKVYHMRTKVSLPLSVMAFQIVVTCAVLPKCSDISCVT